MRDETVRDPKIVAELLQQLGWTHFTILIPIKDALKREFYAQMCRVERWSTRDLRTRIDSMLYERTALSKKPETLIRQDLSALRDKDAASEARPSCCVIRARSATPIVPCMTMKMRL